MVLISARLVTERILKEIGVVRPALQRQSPGTLTHVQA
jgi:hypothetical protein